MVHFLFEMLGCQKCKVCFHFPVSCYRFHLPNFFSRFIILLKRVFFYTNQFHTFCSKVQFKCQGSFVPGFSRKALVFIWQKWKVGCQLIINSLKGSQSTKSLDLNMPPFIFTMAPLVYLLSFRQCVQVCGIAFGPSHSNQEFISLFSKLKQMALSWSILVHM